MTSAVFKSLQRQLSFNELFLLYIFFDLINYLCDFFTAVLLLYYYKIDNKKAKCAHCKHMADGSTLSDSRGGVLTLTDLQSGNFLKTGTHTSNPITPARWGTYPNQPRRLAVFFKNWH